MTTFLFANNAQTTISAPIDAVATSVDLSSGTGSLFPDPGAGEQFAMTFTDAATGLVQEIVYCTARTVDTCTIARGQEGTTARAWAAADLAANLWTAGQAAAMRQTADSSGILISTQVLTSSQIPTYPAGTQTVDIEIVGGGASGGGTAVTGSGESCTGSGGGAGAFVKAIYGIGTVSGAALTIGTGGPAGVAGANGNDGGQTTLGALIVAPGGKAGLVGDVVTAPQVTGPGGNTGTPTVSGADTVIVAAQGPEGGVGIAMDDSNDQGGAGAASPYGPGAPTVPNTGPGVAGPSPGSGGSGASAQENASASVGGQGADGQCIIRSYS